jgi:putative Mn2+ efflux pump MntP
MWTWGDSVQLDMIQIGQLLTLLMVAVALGMDAFSLGIGVGMNGLRLREVLKISSVIAIFHIIMPLIGLFMGRYLSSIIGSLANFTGGGLLVLLGIHMVWSGVRQDEEPVLDHRNGLGLLVFALSVSVDSLSVGLSFGLFPTDILLAVLLFGSVGGLMSALGLLLGRRLSESVGEYGEVFGGIILLVFGIKILL